MRRRLTVVLLLLLAAAALVVIARARVRERASSSLVVERAAAGLGLTVDKMRFERAPLGQTLDKVARLTGLRLEPRWDLLRQAGVDPATPLTLTIERGSARAALYEMLDCASPGATQLDLFIDDRGAVVITTQADYRASAFVARTYDVTRLIPIGGDRRAAETVIADMVRRRIDTRPSVAAGVSDVSVQVIAGRLAVVADRERQLLVEPFLHGQSSAYVKTCARLAGLKLVGQRVWNDVPLSQVLEQLSRDLGVTISTDWPSLHRLSIEPEMPVTMRVRNITAGKLLSVCLDASTLRRQPTATWYVNANGVVIVNARPQDARGVMSVRTYDLYRIARQWPVEPWKRGELNRAVMFLMQNTVDTDSWQLRGGDAWVRADGSRFYVHQTAENHRQIANLLDLVFKTYLPYKRLDFRGSERVPDGADYVPREDTAPGNSRVHAPQ